MVHEAIPSHVPPERVFEFDLYGLNDDERLKPNVQQGLSQMLRKAPEVFFTPANGGHWVVTRYELMKQILQNPAQFSARLLTLPRTAPQQQLIPLSMDPPEHTPYRQILMRYFAPTMVAAMEASVRARARALIAAVAPNGHCDFMKAVSAPLPVFVFMELMGLPMEKFDVFREIVVEWFGIPNGPRRGELAQIILGHLRETIAARRANPQNDLFSRLLSEKIDGRSLSQEELESMSFLLFLAGLDTVANGAGFIFHRLAAMPDLQARLIADPGLIPAFIEEGLRTSGVSTTIRTVMEDVELGGVTIKAGDIVMAPLTIAGFDDAQNPNPDVFDIERRAATHLMFSTGPHLCVGHMLARLELRVLVEEWLRLVPSFSLTPGFARDVRIGSIIGLMGLELSWRT